MHDRFDVPRARAGSPDAPPPAVPPRDRQVARPVASEAVWRSVSAIRDAQARRLRTLAPWRRRDDDADAEGAPSLELVRLLDHLRTALTAFVCVLRDEGCPVERVLAQVQGLVREAAALDGVEPVDRLTHHVVRWTIETYYDRPELRGSPQFY